MGLWLKRFYLGGFQAGSALVFLSSGGSFGLNMGYLGFWTRFFGTLRVVLGFVQWIGGVGDLGFIWGTRGVAWWGNCGIMAV